MVLLSEFIDCKLKININDGHACILIGMHYHRNSRKPSSVRTSFWVDVMRSGDMHERKLGHINFYETDPI